MNGGRTGKISEHAFGNALDIAAFTLADGREVVVKTGWKGAPEEQGFLRTVQASACDRFTTVLAPGSNVYHYDHIHVDLMRRSSGRGICQPAPRVPQPPLGPPMASQIPSQYPSQMPGMGSSYPPQAEPAAADGDADGDSPEGEPGPSDYGHGVDPSYQPQPRRQQQQPQPAGYPGGYDPGYLPPASMPSNGYPRQPYPANPYPPPNPALSAAERSAAAGRRADGQMAARRRPGGDRLHAQLCARAEIGGEEAVQLHRADRPPESGSGREIEHAPGHTAVVDSCEKNMRSSRSSLQQRIEPAAHAGPARDLARRRAACRRHRARRMNRHRGGW